MKKYKCKECGYIHIGDEPPAVCPVCGFDSEVFYEMEEAESSQESGYIEMLDDAGNDTVRMLRQKFDFLSELAVVTSSMSKQAADEARSEDMLFSKVSHELLDQASVAAMMLGEFLEFNTDSNKSELVLKLEKAIEKNEELMKLFEEDGMEEHIDILKKENERYKKFIDKLK